MSLFLLTGLCAAATATPGMAQAQLPAVNLGDTNFEDAFGEPGWLLEEFPSGYTAGQLKDSNGKTVPGSNRITAYSTTTHVAFVSKKSFLRGWLAGEVLLPLVDLDLQLVSGTESRVRGFADLTVGAGLQWAPKKIGHGVFVQRAMIDVGVPTGTYSNIRPVNIGNHFIVVNPFYAFTYERKKVEFSARLHYLWNSANNDPFLGFGIKSTQPGQAFHANYATSYYALFNNVRLGFNGYWLQQLTHHEINGVAVPNSKERTVGLGPGIQLGTRGIWFRVNSYIENGRAQSSEWNQGDVPDLESSADWRRPTVGRGEIAILANFTKSTSSFPPFLFCLFNLLRMARLLHLELVRETLRTVSKTDDSIRLSDLKKGVN